MLDCCKSFTDYCKENHKTLDRRMLDRPCLIYASTKLVFLFFCLLSLIFGIRDVGIAVPAFVHYENMPI